MVLTLNTILHLRHDLNTYVDTHSFLFILEDFAYHYLISLILLLSVPAICNRDWIASCNAKTEIV